MNSQMNKRFTPTERRQEQIHRAAEIGVTVTKGSRPPCWGPGKERRAGPKKDAKTPWPTTSQIRWQTDTYRSRS